MNEKKVQTVAKVTFHGEYRVVRDHKFPNEMYRVYHKFYDILSHKERRVLVGKYSTLAAALLHITKNADMLGL